MTMMALHKKKEQKVNHFCDVEIIISCSRIGGIFYERERQNNGQSNHRTQQ